MNAFFSIEHLIVYTFLAATLLVGLWAGVGIKNIREYAIANKMYGTGVLTITLLATYLGGTGTLGIQKNILYHGLSVGVHSLGAMITFIYAGAFIVPKMLRFDRCITLGDMMHELYGLHGGIITGILGGVQTIALVGAQLVAVGAICESLLGWNKDWSIKLGGAIFILYASWGGVKSVTLTDVLQFIVFIIVIPLIANVAISEAGGIQAVFNTVPADKLSIYQNRHFLRHLSRFLSGLLIPTVLISPPIAQRILMARNRQQATNMFFISAAFGVVVRVLVVLSCLAVLAIFPKITPSDGGAFFYVINTHFSPALKGLSAAGLLAIVMSTLDSCLNAGGLLITRNVLKPYLARLNVRSNELEDVRYITFFMGVASILVAFYTGRVGKLAYLGKSALAPVIVVPLIAGVLGLKTDTRTFLISSAATLITLGISRLLFPISISRELPLLVAVNAISFFAAHIIKHQRIATVKRQEDESDLQPPRRQMTLHIVFALLMCFSYMLSYGLYTGPRAEVLIVIRLLGAVLCVGLLLKPYWGDWLQKYFYAYWHFTLFYCLPFSTTILYVLNGGGTEWVANLALTILMLAMLADWRSFFMISLAGVFLGVLCAFGIQGHMSLSAEYLYVLARTSLASAFVGALLSYSKGQRAERQQKMLEAKEAANQANLLRAAEEKNKALRTFQNIGVDSLLQVAKDIQRLNVQPEDVSKLHAIEAILIPKAFQLQGIDTKAQKYLRLHVVPVNIKQLLATLQAKLKDNGTVLPIHCQQATKHKELVCDPERLATLISKSIAVLQKQLEDFQDEEKDPLLMGIEDTELHYPLPDVAEGYVKKVKALRIVITTEKSLPALSPSYQPDLTTAPVADHPATTQELEKLANERIVQAHYGCVEVVPNAFSYVIPRNLRKVRPKDMDAPYMEFGAAPVRANDLYKSDTIDAQAQEKEFLEAVAQRSSADIGLVKMALELIKWYHGPAYRNSGEPLYLHPLSVAQIVLDYNTDEPTILGALLHETVENTAMLLHHIETVFGSETAKIVDVVTHLQILEKSPFKVKLSPEENLRMLERTGNTRGLYVKLADRMHNMRTRTEYMSDKKRRKKAKRTLKFFVPLAVRLGLTEVAEELKNRSTKILSKDSETSSTDS